MFKIKWQGYRYVVIYGARDAHNVHTFGFLFMFGNL